MNNKKMFSMFLVVAVVAMLVYAVNFGPFNLAEGAPVDGANVSGSINLSALFEGTGIVPNSSIVNVSFAWRLSNTTYAAKYSTYNGNISLMANQTYQNQTANSTFFGNETYFDSTSLPDGVYNITLTFWNTSSGNGSGDNGAFFPSHNNSFAIDVMVDNTVPLVLINEPLATGQNYSISSSNVTFNVSVLDSSIQTAAGLVAPGLVIFEFDNASGNGFNSSSAGAGTPVNQSGLWSMSLNVSNLHAGTHTVTIHVNDTAKNVTGTANSNRTQTWTFEVNTPHNVTWDPSYGSSSGTAHGILSGQNFSASNVTVFFNASMINASVKPAGVGPRITAFIFQFDNASGNAFNLSNGSNVISNGIFQIWNASYNMSALEEGTHTVTIFTNDTLGNVNKTESISFVVDKTGPSVSVSCTDSPTVGSAVTCTCTAIDSLTSVIRKSYTSQSTTAGSAGTYTSSICSATDRVGNVGTGTGSWTVVAASSGGTGSGGSSGGSNTNVAGTFAKEVWSSINAGETATVEVDNGEIGVTEVSFAVKDTTYGAWVKVEKVSSLPSSVKSFGKKTYKNVKITENNVKKALSGNVEVDFKVTKAWLSEQKLSKNNVAMFRYVDGKWTELKTTVGTDDGTYQHYTAETPGFSYFVIGQKEEAAPLTAEEIAAEEVVEETAAAAEEAGEVMAESESATWPWIVLILVVIAGIMVAYWLKNRK